ncbi:hypothetical protein PRIPAC_76512 [Pristionchus pacificus]|uniref:Sulfotransferase family cytosolic 1B member 1 n=1 Tax=Pristionchus pacificus TaxID=54126 RepID=A0A2A6BEU0_PRIPA|nr:hypothetical protein PRIPAC_76512 [Pristionchus pacificus]|eukprot:PDM64425.1 hypothetical protein PRIPAC_52681 [Pristionchus pacificus]
MELCEASDELKQKYLFRIPHSNEFADYVWPGMIVNPEKIISLNEIEFGPDDVVIASYPKSGTTWASEVLSAIAHEGNIDALKSIRMDERVPWIELDDKAWWIKFFYVWKNKMFSTGVDVRPAKKRICFTHLPLELLPTSILEGKCKLLYVARNPKDQAVSYFHFHRMARFLGLQTHTTWDEFFPLFCSGYLYCGSWFEHVLSYWKFTQNNPMAKFICYEDMKRDLMGEMESLEQFVGVPLSIEQRINVVKHCSFDSMKDNKMTNRNGVMLFNEKICKFMRKGIVGDWKNYFTVTQSEAFDELYKKKMEGSGLQFEFE